MWKGRGKGFECGWVWLGVASRASKIFGLFKRDLTIGIFETQLWQTNWPVPLTHENGWIGGMVVQPQADKAKIGHNAWNESGIPSTNWASAWRYR